MLTIKQPNARKTGAVLQVLPHSDCAVTMKVYPQEMSDEIAYAAPVETTLFHDDLSWILMVLLGYEESIRNGMGIYHQYLHHTVRVLFRHVIDPIAGFELEIIRAKNDGSEVRKARIMLQTQDALALSYGIQGVLSSSLIG